MAAALPALAVGDLVEAGGEPRVRDLDLAVRLGMPRPRNIRTNLIEVNRAELEAFGNLLEIQANSPDPKGRGRPGREYLLNEPQALLICMFSRTPKAAEVRREVITVFLAWRHGRLTPAAPALGTEPTEIRLGAIEYRLAALEARLALLPATGATPGPAPANFPHGGEKPGAGSVVPADPAPDAPAELPWAAARADADFGLLQVFAVWYRAYGGPESPGLKIFAAEYSAGRIEAPETVRRLRPTVSVMTLRRLMQRWAVHGRDGLLPRWGNRRGTGAIDRDGEMLAIIADVLADDPMANASVVMAAIKARLPAGRWPPLRTLQRWLATWRLARSVLHQAA